MIITTSWIFFVEHSWQKLAGYRILDNIFKNIFYLQVFKYIML